ncbi:MAG: hypothetical protein AAB847_01000 [Patescibacteria group bacterium]
MKNKYIWIGLILILILGVLLAWPKITNPYNQAIAKWNDLGIECLSNGHQNAGQHIHPHLAIFINGASQIIPAEIGNVRSCMAEVHTHDASGTIHVESYSTNKKFKLQDFFSVWGESIEKPDYKLEMTVDGLLNDQLGNLIMTDKQQIILKYSKL